MKTRVETEIVGICPIYDFDKMIKTGNYDEIGLKPSQINPSTSSGQAQTIAGKDSEEPVFVAVLRFGEFMKAGEILKKAGRMHCYPGNWTHLGGFVEKCPDEQYTFPIAVLGFVIKNEHGDDCVLYAYKDMLTNKRSLGLYRIKNGFHDLFKFIFIDGNDNNMLELL